MQIIYTPDADCFRLDEIQMIGKRELGDPLLKKLRNNYSELKKEVSLPDKVGVVAYHYLIKKEAKEIREEIENPTTTYILLDIFKKILDFQKLDFENPLSREYFSRATSLLLTNTACLDRNIRGEPKIMHSILMPYAEIIKKELAETAEKIKEIEDYDKMAKTLNEDIETLDKLFPTFEDLKKIYHEIEERFEKNKVSKEFPLYFMPTGYSLPFLYTLSLEEKIEQKNFMTKHLKEILELGAKASGLKEIPPEVKKVMEGTKFDKFGETKRIGSLEKLLNQLPEPKTIITDLYLVDNFPQLAEIGFDSYEFKLD